MKTYKKYLVILGLAVLAACKKDGNEPTASAPEADPYVRADQTNEVDHQVFLIYQQSKIPVLYTDTLGKNPLNIVNLNYQIGGFSSTYIYNYPRKKADILSGIAFVRDKILPPLGSKFKVYSISLLDTVKTVVKYSATYSVTTYYNFIPGLTTFGIANVPKISTMTAAQLISFRSEILTNMLISPLNSSGTLTGFYAVSASYYGRYVYGTVTDTNYLQYKDKKEYGFIPNGTESTSSYAIGDQTADLKDYLGKMFTLSAADFQTQYGNYPLVMSKYNLLKTALTSVGFDLTKI